MSRSTYTAKPKKKPEQGQNSGSGLYQRIGEEERLRLTQYSLDHFPEPAIWTDMEARFLYVNDAACAMLGYTRDELLTMSVPDIDPNYPLGKYAVFVENIKQRGYLTIETTHITRDGRAIPVELSTHYLKFGGREYIISFNRNISGRIKAEAAIRESEEKYRSLVENINDMVWEVDLDFTCTYASPKTRDLIGYAPEEVIGKKPYDFIYPEDLPGAKEIFTQIIQGRKPMKLIEYRVLRKDGRIMCMETNGEPIIDSAGRLIGYRGINRDVTDKREAEEALRKNEQFLSRIFNSFQDGISILDKDLNIVRVNSALEKMYPYMIPLRGKACYYAYHGRGTPCEVCPSLRAMKLKTMQSDIVPLHGARGEQTGWLEIYSFPLLDDNGNVTGVIEHVRDITARKRAEDELQESEERFRLFADMTPAILLIYQDNKYIYANRAAEEITGYSQSELYQENPWFLIHPDYRNYIRGRVWARQHGEPISSAMELKIIAKNGEEKWMAMTSTTITYKNRPAGIVVAFDTTERKKTATALEEAKSRAELYLDLITHDINNMNQIGIGFLEMLIDTPRLDDHERELLAKSMESLESSTRLIQNVQKLQKVRSGKMHNQKVDVGQVLAEVMSYYTRTKGGEHLDYIPATGCYVMANGLLFDIFSNLVGNAIKHTNNYSSPIVRIRLDKVTEAGKVYCRVTVEDRGPGIPDTLKDRIFDRLRRGETKARGKGLGLYLVKSLVESYEGRVWVEDRVPGDHTMGSRFVVMLPAVEQ